jgi:ribosomal protein S18 acetylase RimI-like enzyme
MPTLSLRRFLSQDLDVYLAVRHEGLRADAGSFRISVADDETMGRAAWSARLDRDYVVGVEREGRILGIGGFGRIAGMKTEHKGLIWGMYVRAEARGGDTADMVMTALLAFARTQVRQVQLTVVADNARAVRFYERHGFIRYGVEPAAIRMADGSYVDEAMMWRLV